MQWTLALRGTITWIWASPTQTCHHFTDRALKLWTICCSLKNWRSHLQTIFRAIRPPILMRIPIPWMSTNSCKNPNRLLRVPHWGEIHQKINCSSLIARFLQICLEIFRSSRMMSKNSKRALVAMTCKKNWPTPKHRLCSKDRWVPERKLLTRIQDPISPWPRLSKTRTWSKETTTRRGRPKTIFKWPVQKHTNLN